MIKGTVTKYPLLLLPLLLPPVQVADVCVEALVCPAAEGKVVEVIAEKGAPALPMEALFEGLSMTWP